VPIAAATVAAHAGALDCVALAEQLRARSDRVGLLVMGDGSACRGQKAPGYDDPRAQPYDDGVARALATADAAALRGLDPLLSAELLVAGRAPWHVLASAADGGAGGNGGSGDGGAPPAGWRAALTYYAAPYGVAYFVASWARR
jgi:hypothetical protein